MTQGRWLDFFQSDLITTCFCPFCKRAHETPHGFSWEGPHRNSLTKVILLLHNLVPFLVLLIVKKHQKPVYAAEIQLNEAPDLGSLNFIYSK